MQRNIILGIDPGSQNTGFGLIDASGSSEKFINFGTIQIPKAYTLPKKLNFLHQSLNDIITEFKPNFLALEDIFLGKNPKSAFILGHVRGVCLQIASQNNLEIGEYAARNVKKTITGRGNATKEQVQAMVHHLLNIKASGELFDATDALAIALTHSRQLSLENLMNRGANIDCTT